MPSRIKKEEKKQDPTVKWAEAVMRFHRKRKMSNKHIKNVKPHQLVTRQI